jgi:hypothetical protein
LAQIVLGLRGRLGCCQFRQNPDNARQQPITRALRQGPGRQRIGILIASIGRAVTFQRADFQSRLLHCGVGDVTWSADAGRACVDITTAGCQRHPVNGEQPVQPQALRYKNFNHSMEK